MSGVAGDDGFAHLTRAISECAGLTVESYKDKCLRRRIAVRMRASGVHTYDEYRELIVRDGAELERLRDALTINVTRFYRNPDTWARLRDGPLAELWRRRDGHLRVWSAGCASGEEPYTVAMLVAEIAREADSGHWLPRLEIDATDIDRLSLQRARTGVYRVEAFQDMPAVLLDRYTLPVGDARAVRPDLLARVRVQAFDLNADRAPRSTYDLIICRNVVIYFDRPMQERLFELFARHLAADGLLVLGKVETLLGPARELLSLVDARERIYRRSA